MRHSIEQSLRATIRDALLSGQTESGHLATSSSGSLQLRPKHNESHPDIPSSKETLELAAI
jgi:hypothetical protein